MKFYTVRINNNVLSVRALNFSHAIHQAACFYGVEMGVIGSFSVTRMRGFDCELI